jgi:putative ABC transport system substrate-binding protein
LCCGQGDAGTETFRILVLNSDASVEKYSIPQQEFQKVISLPVSVIDLGKKKLRPADIEDLLYDQDPDLIYCIGTKSYLLANKYLRKTPVVFSSIINWRRLPNVDRAYGVSNELHAGMDMMLVRYIFPEVQSIGVLYTSKYTEEWFKEAKELAEEVGIELVGLKVSKNKDVTTQLEKLLATIHAFWLIPDPELMKDKHDLQNILQICERQKIPVFSYHHVFAQYGAALTTSVDIPTIGRQAAGITMELLTGGEPEENVQFPAGSYIVLNLKKVKEYGLIYNEDALSSVNRIIRE